MMLLDILKAFFGFFDNIIGNLPLSTLLDFIDTLKTSFPLIRQYFSIITYFVPLHHLSIIFGALAVFVTIKLILSIYNAIAQVIP